MLMSMWRRTGVLYVHGAGDRGSWIDSMTVVHNGSQRIHAVSDLGVQIRRPAAAAADSDGGGGSTASFVSLDSALVRIGAVRVQFSQPCIHPHRAESIDIGIC